MIDFRMRTLEDELEDFIWGRIKEQEYLERIVRSDDLNADAVLQRVGRIDDTVNKQLRKGVEENLSRLLAQTTALEALEKTQRGVHAEMSEIHVSCDRLASRLGELATEYRAQTEALETAFTQRNLLADAARCEELMESFEKRTELVKRSEIICELRGIVEDNPQLMHITWLKPTITDKLKSSANRVRALADEELRGALDSLNASFVAAATRALSNLGMLDAELDSLVTALAANADSQLVELAASTEQAPKQLAPAVRAINNQLEQCALLGPTQLGKLAEKLARIVRARVPVDAPFALRFVQQMCRVLSSAGASSSHQPGKTGGSPVQPLLDALRPLKTGVMSHALARLHQLVSTHDLSGPQGAAFVDVLSSALSSELSRVEWDGELRDEMARSASKCMDMLARRIEGELDMGSDAMLMGDRLTAAQVCNYRLLGAAAALSAHWPAQSNALIAVQTDAVNQVIAAARSSLIAIFASQHKDGGKGKRGGLSPYMHECCEYLGRIALHATHLTAVLQQTDGFAPLVDFVIDRFVLHASLCRPRDEATRQQQHSDLDALLAATSSLSAPSAYPRPEELLESIALPAAQMRASEQLPEWIILHCMLAECGPSIKSPHESVDWQPSEYAEWCAERSEEERYSFLSGLLSSYSQSVHARGESEYEPHYPAMLRLIEDGVKRSKPAGK